MFATSFQNVLLYDQLSCQLRLEGLPDLSAGQSGNDLGILTGWTLRWPGRPELEGERDHLEALLAAVLPYARNLVSDLARPCGPTQGPIWIGPAENGGHTLHLLSRQEGNPTLDVPLDDAELADLVRVLDQMRGDPRNHLALAAPPLRPLKARELIRRIPLRRRLVPPLGGVAALALAGVLSFLVPPPSPSPRRGTAEASPAARPADPSDPRSAPGPAPVGGQP
jgi:hypothetical protein